MLKNINFSKYDIKIVIRNHLLRLISLRQLQDHFHQEPLEHVDLAINFNLATVLFNRIYYEVKSVNLVTLIVVCFFKHFWVELGILWKLVDNLELKVVLFKLYQSWLVLYLFVKAPHLIYKHSRFERDHILLLRTERKHLVILLIIDNLMQKVSIAKLNDCLLGSPDFC